MDWLNYHHLQYFWKVARAGSIRAAAAEMRVSPPAISMQLNSLEETLGEPLFERTRRKLVLTDVGRVVYEYADEIFNLGSELLEAVRSRPTGRPLRLVVGIVDVLPKLIAQWLIEPALQLEEPVRIVCREASADKLVAQLALHELDVVLSDSPFDPSLNIKAYNHLLGECGITFVGAPGVLPRGRFPRSLNHAPMLLPTDNTALRRALDQWFGSLDIHPEIVGEFEDYALLRLFGEAGRGIFPLPSIFERQLHRASGIRRLGSTEAVRSRFYAISLERKLQHPGVMAICGAARRELFA